MINYVRRSRQIKLRSVERGAEYTRRVSFRVKGTDVFETIGDIGYTRVGEPTETLRAIGHAAETFKAAIRRGDIARHYASAEGLSVLIEDSQGHWLEYTMSDLGRLLQDNLQGTAELAHAARPANSRKKGKAALNI